MQTLTVSLASCSYPIHIGENLLSQAELLLPHLPSKKVAVVTNTTVAALYLAPLQTSLHRQGIDVLPIILPDGEEYKNAETLAMIYNALLTHRCERNTTILALGGGVVGDMAGFAAATYLRGVPFIQIPTTLLAQVDSSVGGKTGINHALGKNMIGAFYQPQVVLADIATLTTLPDRELRAGIAEVIKYGLIRDLPFFEWLETNMEKIMAREPEALVHAIYESCRNKAEVVTQDERETGIRAILNLGHTFGHAIETATGYGTWLHGEAVGMGIVMAADLSMRRSDLGKHDCARIKALLVQANLPVTTPNLGVDKYLELMSADKKVESGNIRFVLLERVGQASIVTPVAVDLLVATLSNV